MQHSMQRERIKEVDTYLNRAGALGKKILDVKVFVTKIRRRQCTKCIESLDIYVTRKESPNRELNNK